LVLVAIATIVGLAVIWYGLVSNQRRALDELAKKIADQKMKELEQHAGHKVEIAGTMKGDTITVTKVTMLKQ